MQSMDATTENAPDGGSERGPHVGDNEITIAYQPIIRGAAVVCGLYYLSHLAIRLLNPETALLGVMVPLDALGAATGLAVRLFLSRPRSPNALEVCGGLLCLNLFVTANTPQLFDFQAENLIYIALIMPVSAAVLPRPDADRLRGRPVPGHAALAGPPQPAGRAGLLHTGRHGRRGGRRLNLADPAQRRSQLRQGKAGGGPRS